MNARKFLYIKGRLRSRESAIVKPISGDRKMTERSNVAAHIAYDDLREWLALAERMGEVRIVRGASGQEDIGLAAEAGLRAENGPWVVREDGTGGPKGLGPRGHMVRLERSDM